MEPSIGHQAMEPFKGHQTLKHFKGRQVMELSKATKQWNLQGPPNNGTDALPSPGVNPLKGSPKCRCEKLGLGRRSRLPAL
jgi:hypothetical protein